MIKPIEIGESTLQSFQLQDIAEQLCELPAYERSGRTAATLARDDRMTVALTVIRAGATIRKHEAPGPVTLLPLAGRLRLLVGDDAVPLEAMQAVVLSGTVAHAVEAVEDSTLLIVIGGRT